jgi:hypothetical protein
MAEEWKEEEPVSPTVAVTPSEPPHSEFSRVRQVQLIMGVGRCR